MGKNPIVITSPIVRMYFRNLAKDYYKDIIVISYNEVESNVELQSVGDGDSINDSEEISGGDRDRGNIKS